MIEKDIKEQFNEPSEVYRPFMRWWWFGNDLQPEHIVNEVNEMADKYVGGVEIQSIYTALNGSKYMEENIIEWRSNEWLDIVETAVQSAKKRNLTVDMTFGNGWPFGGPYITPEYASSRLKCKRKIIIGNKARSIRLEKLYKEPNRICAIITSKLSLMRRKERQLINLTDKLDKDVLNWESKNGIWILYVFCTVQTKQKVKRAAPAGEGWVLDHLDRNAFNLHAKEFGGRLVERFGEDLSDYFGSFFCDSWEVSRATWTSEFLKKFEERKGYDLSDYLPYLRLDKLLGKFAASKNCQSVIYDYREFLSHLILTEFFETFSNYCHSVGVGCRVQPYSAPTDLLKAYSFFDVLEIEGFGKHGIGTMYYGKFDPRLASSAAHIYGKKMVSCESFTWLGEHFTVSLEQLKKEADQIILHGINRIIYHGFSSSPEEAGVPGLVFYASILANPNNTWWPYIDKLNKYIARNALISRESANVADFLVYMPLHDEWSGKRSHVKHLRQELKKNGFFTNFDYVNDECLQARTNVVNGEIRVGTGQYKYLILWDTEYLPDETMNAIASLVKDGGSLIIIGESPKYVPGFMAESTDKKDLTADVEKLMKEPEKGKILCVEAFSEIHTVIDNQDYVPDFQFQNGSEHEESIKYLHNRTENFDYYFVVNESKEEIETEVIFRAKGNAQIWDPMTGVEKELQIVSLKEKNGTRTKIKVKIKPLEAFWIVISEMIAPYEREISTNTTHDSILREITLNENWSINFPESKNLFPHITEPVIQISNATLFDWRDSGNTKYFAGTATYTNKFSLNENQLKETSKVILSLGEVFEIADVNINGNSVDVLWYGSNTLEITKYVKEGENDITVNITNLLLNKVIGYDRRRLKWKPKYFFVNNKYLPFKAKIMKLLPSGLVGPVKIIIKESKDE